MKSVKAWKMHSNLIYPHPCFFLIHHLLVKVMWDIYGKKYNIIQLLLPSDIYFVNWLANHTRLNPTCQRCEGVCLPLIDIWPNQSPIFSCSTHVIGQSKSICFLVIVWLMCGVVSSSVRTSITWVQIEFLGPPDCNNIMWRNVKKIIKL